VRARGIESLQSPAFSTCGLWFVLDLLAALPWQSFPTGMLMQYVQALYWCINTMTTVGHGDMKARTNAQMLYTIVAVGLALRLWGQLILQMTRLHAARLRAAPQQRPSNG
jgi:Ion channel